MLTRKFSAAGPDWLLTALARMTINFLAERDLARRGPGRREVLGIGNRSFRSAYGVFRDDRCLATAECVSVWFDPRARHSVEPPAEVRHAMEAELHSSAQRLQSL